MSFETYVWKLHGLDHDDKIFLKLANKSSLLNLLWDFFVSSTH